MCIAPGFDMMEAFGLTRRAHSSVEGVAADPFVFSSLPIYSLYRDTQLTQSTKSVPGSPRVAFCRLVLERLPGWPRRSPSQARSRLSRYIHPMGFPAEHTISIGFRVLQSTPREPFALWQLTDNDFQPKMGVTLDREYSSQSATLSLVGLPVRCPNSSQ